MTTEVIDKQIAQLDGTRATLITIGVSVNLSPARPRVLMSGGNLHTGIRYLY